MTKINKRKHSAPLVDGPEQAPSRSMLRAAGFEDDVGTARMGSWGGTAICIKRWARSYAQPRRRGAQVGHRI